MQNQAFIQVDGISKSVHKYNRERLYNNTLDETAGIQIVFTKQLC